MHTPLAVADGTVLRVLCFFFVARSKCFDKPVLDIIHWGFIAYVKGDISNITAPVIVLSDLQELLFVVSLPNLRLTSRGSRPQLVEKHLENR